MIRFVNTVCVGMVVSLALANLTEAKTRKVPAKVRNPASDCRKTPWPFDRNVTRKDVQQALERQPRGDGYQYLFDEVTRSRENNLLANTLWFYLFNTEADPDRQGFLAAIGDFAEIKDPRGPVKVVDFEELCSVYAKLNR